MKAGDLVRTPPDCTGNSWWWTAKVGVIVQEALPITEHDPAGNMLMLKCWHVLIGTRTANLKEDSLELVNETR